MPSRDKPRGGVALRSAAGGHEASPAEPEPVAPPPPTAAAPIQPAAKTTGTSRRALKNWRVRSRLLLLITIPTLTAVVLGGTRIVTSVHSALTDQRIEHLANLSSAVTTLAGTLEDERDQTVVYTAQLTGGSSGATPMLALLKKQYAKTDAAAAQVRSDVAGIGSAYPPQVRQDVSSVRYVLGDLPTMRHASVTEDLGPLVIVEAYASSIDYLIAVDNDISLNSGDPQLGSSVRALGIVAQIEELASEQRAILAYALAQHKFAPNILLAFSTAEATTSNAINQFTDSALPAQTSLFHTTVSGGDVELADEFEQQAVLNSGNLPSTNITEAAWYTAMTGEIGQVRAVEHKLVGDAVSRASALRRSAIIDAIAIGVAVLIVLGLALVLTSMVGRSMVRPLRRLRAGALEVAGLQLPETVRRMSESDGSGVPVSAAPIDVDSTDEIGEVARAFDQVHREALRLAANEAALRGNVNAMFVNLSRRSQSLVERQIRLIDDLEQGEQDDERLGSLFQMDHLATRMRRNSENLLVLAGHDSSRRWNQPVALVDVLRAAVSEIEQYERVSLNVQPGISVRGHAVNDVVHLLAELAENATSFSSAETPVTVSGHLLSSGGVLLDITDQGVGMGAEEMAHANWRLDNPPVVDVAVSRRMGLFVVARLAARHGVRVRLRPAASGGLTALVWLPDEVVSRDGASPSGARMPDAPAEAVNVTMPTAANGDHGTDERWATAQEVSAARTPKFAPLQTAAGEGSGLGPRRVPGSGPRPGATPWPESATGSGFPTSPRLAGEAVRGPFETGPQPAVGADGFGGPEQVGQESAASDFTSPGLESTGLASTGPAGTELASTGFSGTGFAGTGPLPAVDRETWGSWPDPGGIQPASSQPASSQPASFPPATSQPAISPSDSSPSDSSPAASSPAAAQSSLGGEQSTGIPAAGSAQKLPKRRVDRGEPGDSGAGPERSASTDMFGAARDRASGSLFGTSPQPAGAPDEPAIPESASPEPAQLADSGAGPRAAFNAPVPSDLSASGPKNGTNGSNGINGSNGYGWEVGASGDAVVVPPPELGTEYRLPIFEAVESDWFRRGRSSVGWAPQEQEAAEPQESSTWSSPADEGWQAAASAAVPSSSGVTPAGLPKRVPRANLVPGTAGAEAPSAVAPPARSAAATRDRFSSFQRGIREGRAAAGGENPAGEDDGS